MVLKTLVNTKDPEGNDLVLAIRTPSAAVKQKARLVYAKSYKEAIEGGAMIKQQAENYIRSMNLWDDVREAEFQKLRKSLLAGEKVIETKRHEDGSPVKLTEAREIAIKMNKDRQSLQELLSVRSGIEANTADSIAEQSHFNYLVAACTVYNDGAWEGKPYFTRDRQTPAVEDYVERGTEQAAFDAASKLSELIYGSEIEILKKLPENEFLQKYKFMDSDGHLVNKDGHKIDEKGRPVNEDGYFVDADGNRVDSEGNRVDEAGRYVGDDDAFFLDEDGNPVVPDGESEPEVSMPSLPQSDV